MAERVVKVRLSAQVAEYKQGMLEAAQATRSVGTEGEKLAQQREAFQLLGRTMLTAGGLMAAGVGVAIAKFADFDQQMSAVQAATHESAENMALLRDASLEAGAKTVYSATESAAAVEELAKAGISTADILNGGLNGALNLAAAGGLGVAEAAGVAATTMQQFGLKGSDASHVADLLAAGAGKAMGDVSDLSQALKQSGLVANQFGISVEETTATLSAFASAGLLGSDAGTSFRTMLLRLANPTGEAAEEMRNLNINAYDAQGQFVGMKSLAGQLETSMKGLTQEQKNASLAIIFGQDAIRGANVLLDEGADGIQEWTDKVNDQGYAAETAATRLDNLKGDWEQLTGALDTAFITMGEGANGPLRLFVQWLTSLVDAFNGLPDWGQQTVFWFGVVGAAAATAGGLFFTSIPKIVEYRAAMDTLGPSAQKAGRGLAAAARGVTLLAVVGAATAGVDALAESITKGLLPSVEQTQNKFKTAASGVDVFAAALSARGVIDPAKAAAEELAGLGKILDSISTHNWWEGPIVSDITDTVAEIGKQLGTLAGKDLPSAQAQFRQLAKDAGLSTDQQKVLINQMPEFRDALLAASASTGGLADDQALLKAALGESEPATKDNTEALSALAGQADGTGDSIDDLADKIRGFGSATLDTREAQRTFEASLDDLQAAIEKNGATLDITTQAGRDNESALDDLASSTLDYSAALVQQTGDQQAASQVIADGRQRLIDMLGQFGITGQAAQDYADKLGLIPGNVTTAAQLTGVDEASRKMEEFINAYNNRTIKLGVSAETIVGNPSMGYKNTRNADGGLYDYVQAFADGGLPNGIYNGGRPLYKFAEPETGWEAFISGKQDQRDRNIGIWAESGDRLGAFDALVRAVSTKNDQASPPVAFPGAVELVVDGHSFTGFLKAKAGEVVAATSGTFLGGRR